MDRSETLRRRRDFSGGASAVFAALAVVDGLVGALLAGGGMFFVVTAFLLAGCAILAYIEYRTIDLRVELIEQIGALTDRLDKLR